MSSGFDPSKHPMAGIAKNYPKPEWDALPPKTVLAAIPKPCEYNELATARQACRNPACPYAPFHRVV